MNQSNRTVIELRIVHSEDREGKKNTLTYNKHLIAREILQKKKMQFKKLLKARKLAYYVYFHRQN